MSQEITDMRSNCHITDSAQIIYSGTVCNPNTCVVFRYIPPNSATSGQGTEGALSPRSCPLIVPSERFGF